MASISRFTPRIDIPPVTIGSGIPCTRCDLHKTRTQEVWSRGKAGASIMIVGEAPGKQEDLQGYPFVGRSGELLDEALVSAFGENIHDYVYITNTVKCRPPANRNPTQDEMETCFYHLNRQYAYVKPKLIVAMGKVAAEFILRRPVKITKEHGSIDFMYNGLDGYSGDSVLICYHPAYVLRNPKAEIKQGFFQTIKDARRIAYGIPNVGLHANSSR